MFGSTNIGCGSLKAILLFIFGNVSEKLSLISQQESDDSTVMRSEQNAFLKPEVKKKEEKAPPPAEDAGDLVSSRLDTDR